MTDPKSTETREFVGAHGRRWRISPDGIVTRWSEIAPFWQDSWLTPEDLIGNPDVSEVPVGGDAA